MPATRPTPNTITAALQGWDADLEANFNLIFETPLPLARYANAAALPSAASYMDCAAVLEDEHALVISDGTNWVRVPLQAAAQADSAAAIVADLVTDFNALLAKLRTAGVLAT